MSPRKDDEHIDGLQPVERAWRDLGAEVPPDLVDQAILNRARLAAEKPERAWTFNLTWVHGLATMGVAALALTLFLQLRDEVPQAPVPAAFQVPRPETVNERKDEASAGIAPSRERQVLARKSVPEPATAPPQPAHEERSSLADAPGKEVADEAPENTTSEDSELDALHVVEPNPRDDNQAAQRSPVAAADAAGLDSFEKAAATSTSVEEFRLEAEPVIGAPAPGDSGPITAEKAAKQGASTPGEGQSLAQDRLQAPVDSPPVTGMDSAWPDDPDTVSDTNCRSAEDQDDAGAGSETGCQSPSFAEALFDQLRNLEQRGEAERYRALLAEFRAHYPDYPLPEDLRE